MELEFAQHVALDPPSDEPEEVPVVVCGVGEDWFARSSLCDESQCVAVDRFETVGYDITSASIVIKGPIA